MFRKKKKLDDETFPGVNKRCTSQHPPKDTPLPPFNDGAVHNIIPWKKHRTDLHAALESTNHPMAPFPGNTIEWSSFLYDDGTTYEGLTLNNIPHGKGVMIFGECPAAGFQHAKKGDRYEGEFMGGFAHGLGAYYSNGDTYRGAFAYGSKHGEHEAWKKVKNAAYKKTQFGVYNMGKLEQKKGSMETHGWMLENVTTITMKARLFEDKPSGDACLYNNRFSNRCNIVKDLFQVLRRTPKDDWQRVFDHMNGKRLRILYDHWSTSFPELRPVARSIRNPTLGFITKPISNAYARLKMAAARDLYTSDYFPDVQRIQTPRRLSSAAASPDAAAAAPGFWRRLFSPRAPQPTTVSPPASYRVRIDPDKKPIGVLNPKDEIIDGKNLGRKFLYRYRMYKHTKDIDHIADWIVQEVEAAE